VGHPIHLPIWRPGHPSKHIYKVGPTLKLARRVGALDEKGRVTREFVLALAETLDGLESRHARN
jgi:hypothetical protein